MTCRNHAGLEISLQNCGSPFDA